MRKGFLLIPLAVVLVMALIFGGCKAAPKAPEEILIGSNAAMTGMFGAFGEGCVFGYRAAIEDINNQGGVYVEEYGRKLPLRLIVADNESNPAKVGTLAEDLVLRDNVRFLISPDSPCDMHNPTSTVADRHKVPHIISGGPLEPWLAVRQEVTPPWEYTWFTGFAIATPAAEGDFRYGKPGYTSMDTWIGMLNAFGGQTNKKVGIFASDDADGVGWYGIFPSVLENWGADVLGAERNLGLFPIGTTDFTPIIEEWKDYGCEIIWGNCPAPDFGTLWRQCHTLGFQPKMAIAIRAHLFYTDVNAWGGDLPLGVAGDIWWTPNMKDSPGIGGTTPKSLADRWVEATGEPVNPAIGHGYPSIQILVDAIERAGTLDPEALNEAIGATDLMTITNRVVFDQDEHFSRLPLFQGQWQKVDEPWVWECPVIFAEQDFVPIEAEMLFPIPYD
jgi:branched-chain amino acid transport system substrate-binding protein